MLTIGLVYINAGGGHRAAATALEAVIREQRRPWRVRTIDLLEILDPQQVFRKLTGMPPEDIYNKRLARGWTLGLAQELKLLQALIRLGHGAMLRQLVPCWQQAAPDMLVSLVPNFNRALGESLALARPGVPFVTVMTDMADHPPNFWIEPGTHQHIVCGTTKAVAQARAMGMAEQRIHRVSGMIMRPDFYRPACLDRDAARQGLGLEPATPTGVVMFGGQGSKAMRTVAEQLHDIPLILLCGHNRQLAETLRALPSAAPRVVVEFTQDVARYMQLGDFFIGKPGPGSISEAVQMGLPVIVVRNAWTMPQERYNAQWVREQQAGIVHRSYGSIRPAVTELIGQLDGYRDRVRRIRNRAVFEVPQVLAGILDAAFDLRAQREPEAAAMTYS